MTHIGDATAPARDSNGAHRSAVKSYLRRDIQGLRAIAVILVVIVHARLPLSGGFVGVDIFFVISGYVITGLIYRELSSTGRLDWKRFYRRRILRLLPALAAMTTLTATIGILALSPLGIQQQSAAAGGAATLWSSNFALYAIAADYFSDQTEANPFLHTWSLGVEEQFYLIFPLLIIIAWRIGTRPSRKPLKTLAAGVGAFTAGSFALSLAVSMGWVSFVPNPGTFAFYGSPTRAWEFGAGALLALLPAYASTVVNSARVVATWVGLLLVAIAAVGISSSDPFPGTVALLPIVGCALLIWGGSASSPVSAALSTRWPVYIGDVSYSWYLWHWPYIVFARRLFPGSAVAIAIAVALSFGTAILSYHLFEQRFREDSLHRRPFLKPLLIAVFVPGTACAVMLAGSVTQWGSSSLALTAGQLLQRPLGYNTCLSTVPVSSRNIASCTWGANRPGKPIYLLGDSNAQQFTEGVIAAGQRTDRPVVVATWGGCALVNVNYFVKGQPLKYQQCNTYVQDTLKWLRTERKGTVIMGSANSGIYSTDVTMSSGGSAPASGDPKTKEALWQAGIVSVVKDLKAQGQSPLLVHLVPHFPSTDRPWWSPVECQNYTLLEHPSNCGRTLTLAEVQTSQFLEFESESAAAKLTGIPIMDLRPVLCPHGVCDTYRNGLWVYRDGLHISPMESRRLSTNFVDAITAKAG